MAPFPALMSKPFRVGIIGAGGIAGGAHVPGWKKLAGVEIVAVADVSESRAKAMAEKEGIPNVFADYHGIHALDTCLWFMNFPTPTTVVGTTKVNLPRARKSRGCGASGIGICSRSRISRRRSSSLTRAR